MESVISFNIPSDKNQKLFYNNKSFIIPKIYLVKIDTFFNKKNLNEFLSDENELKKLEKFMPSNTVFVKLKITFRSFSSFIHFPYFLYRYPSLS